MKKIFIIGTSHTTQKDLSRTDFSDFLEQVVDCKNIGAIAEEINDEKSVIEQVVKKLNLEYRNIEPNVNERVSLGIPRNLSHIDHEIIMKHDNYTSHEAQSELKLKQQEMYSKREDEWERRISKLTSDSVLVICGANHVNSFYKLLENFGYTVEIISSLME
ncbi:hypothetical protein [Enterovibrio norvegicus]|uniref:hypothetical protein n=1 Tax=Enterovibrio norvegicus TaxID=188144 RepID=UPI000C85A645|nr:hypothetical protein [Enterovibrio norvegicus]PMN65654.1 hypothetical protein BCT27_09585 [Enterovibrio norvegicus]